MVSIPNRTTEDSTRHSLNLSSPNRLLRLVGRANEETSIVDLLTRCDQGFGGATVIEGEAGIGKSALLDRTEELASDRGFLVRRILCAPMEQHRPFGALSQLLSGDGSAHHLDDPLLATILRGDPSANPPARASAAGSLLVYLSTLATDRSVLVIVDDLQWCDDSSAQVLAFVSRRLLADRVVLLFARRIESMIGNVSVGASTMAGNVEHTVVDLRGLPRIALEPLGDREAIDVLVALGCDRLATARHAPLAAGSPLALVELAAQLRSGTVFEEEIVFRLPAYYKEVVANLDPEVLRTLVVCALDDDLRTVLALNETSVSALAKAEEFGIVRIVHEHVRFRHPLLRGSVLGTLQAGERRELHRRIAETLDPIKDRDRFALHLGVSVEEKNDRAATALGEFAERARQRGAVAESVFARERAAALAETVEQSALHLLAAGAAIFDTGDSARAVSFGELVLELSKVPTTRADASKLIADASTWEGSPDSTTKRFLDLAELAKEDDPSRAAHALVSAGSMAFLQGDLHRGLEISYRAESLAASCGDSIASLGATGMIGWNQFLLGNLDESAQKFDSLEFLVRALIDARVLEGVSFGHTWVMRLIMLERFEEADLMIGQILPIAQHLAVRLSVSIVSMITGSLRWRQGRWNEALALATGELIPGTLPSISMAWGSAAAAQVTASLGLVEQTYAHLDNVHGNLPDGEIPLVRAWSHAALGHLLLSQENEADALVELRETARLVEQMGLKQPEFFLWAGDYLDALVSVGSRTEALEVLKRFSETYKSFDLDWPLGVAARTRGRLAATLAEADEEYQQALERFEAIGMPFEIGRTWFYWGETKRHFSAPAETEFSRAEAYFSKLNARLWLKRAIKGKPGSDVTTSPASSSDATGRPQLSEVLSDAELRVALAVAAGRSNREAAAELYLSARTIEFHLTSVFRKLGAKNRSQLIRVLQGS